jgi:hypothetical protein
MGLVRGVSAARAEFGHQDDEQAAGEEQPTKSGQRIRSAENGGL